MSSFKLPIASSSAIILPSINRGTPRTVAQSLSGILAYASRNNIIFLDTTTIPPKFLDSYYLPAVHRSKINVLSFAKYEGFEFLASCGTDGELKVWDLKDKSCLQKIQVKETNALEWVYGSPDTLVYSSEGKFLVKYNVKRNSQLKIRTASEFNICVISASAKNSELVAAGHCNGIISIVNVVQEKLVYKLKAHHAEITDLSWNHDSPDVLLSFSLDLSVRLWKLGEDSPQSTYYAPPARFRNEDKKNQSPRLLGLFHPTMPDVVISVDTKGEIGEISMKSENPTYVAYAMKNMENNLRYPIALFLSSCRKYLFCWDSFKVTKISILKKELVTNFPFTLGFVYDLSISRVNPNLLSISNGDGILKVYDGCPQSNRSNVTSIYIYFRTKIMTAAWHPRSENILAYATDEGRVGVVDIFRKKNVCSFETHHTGACYSLVWGPCALAKNEDNDDGLYLYSCGGGTVYINKENNFKTKALCFDTLINKPDEYSDSNQTYSEVCWNFDYTLLCIGSFKGFVELFDASLNFLGRLIVPMKSVECLRWHPETTYMSPNGSPLKAWLACSGTENEIYIFDTAELSSATQPEVFMSRPRKKLIGHKKRVVSLSWSEHSCGFLASASKDGCAMVWNLETNGCIATFLAHFDAVLSVQWSATDKDIIYSGGQDGSVKAWKISEVTPKQAPDKAPVRRRLKKIKRNEIKSLTDTTETGRTGFNDTLEEIENSLDASDDLNTICNGETMIVSSTDGKSFVKPLNIRESVGSGEVKEKKDKSNAIYGKRSILFPNHNFEESDSKDKELENCRRLAEILSAKQKKTPTFDLNFDSVKKNELSDSEVLKFGLYSDQLTVLRMLDLQTEKISPDDIAAAMFSGNIKEMLINAAEMKKLTTAHVSMAPAVSHSFWLEICEKFASQLIDTQYYLKAAQYYLMCGKIHTALDLLANKGNIVDAVALAKARLPGDPIINKLFIMLKKKYELSKNTAAVVQCELALNEPLKAAKMLASTLDPDAVKTAVYICQQYELNMQASEYLFLFLETCLAKYSYLAYWDYVDEEPFLGVYKALVNVHENFHVQVQYLKPRDGLSLSNIFSSKNNSTRVKVWSGVVDQYIKQPFIKVLYSVLLSKNIFSEKKYTIEEIMKALKILEERRKSLEISSEVQIPISIFLTEYILLMHKEEDFAIRVLLKTFQAFRDISYLPRVLCLLFFPIDLYWNEESKSFNCEILASINSKEDNCLASYLKIHEPYSLILQSIIEKIQSFKITTKKLLFTKEDLQSNLITTTSKIKQILLSKGDDEFLFTYFVANLTSELQKIIKKEKLVYCSLKNVSSKSNKNCDDPNIANDASFNKSSINESNDGHNCLSEKMLPETDKNAPINSIKVDNVAENYDKNAVGDTSIETLKIKDAFSLYIEKNSTENVCQDIQPYVCLSVDDENNSSSIELDVPILCEKQNVDCQENVVPVEVENLQNVAESSENGVISTAENEDVLIINKNDFVDLHDIQLKELIQSVIEEADLKAQAIREKNVLTSHAAENKTEETNNHSLNNGISSYESSENIKSPMYTNSCSEFVASKLEISQKVEEEQHESCSSSIDLFYTIISLISHFSCRDEFALLYYLKERLNHLNNKMSATVLSEKSKEFLKNNKGKGKKYAKNIKPKNPTQTLSTELSLTSDNISENNTSDPAQVEETNCDIINENDITNLTLQIKETTCDNINVNNTTDIVPLIEEIKSDNTGENNTTDLNQVEETTCDNIYDNKIADQTAQTLESSISDNSNEYKKPENKVPIDEDNLNTIHSSETKDSMQNDILIGEEKAEVVTNGNKPCDEETSDASFYENLKNTKDACQKISMELLKEEHTIITNALAILQENEKCCAYPNPFDILSKLSEVVSHVIHQCQCPVDRSKLHNFFHNIIIDWSDKFCIGEIKYECKTCNAAK